MARSPVAIFNSKFPNVEGLEALQRKVAALPDAIVDEVKPALDRGAKRFVAKVKSIAPVSELEANPGDLRDSVHTEPGRHELAVQVIEDAVDEAGKAYPAHVEYGHKAPDGSHVEAKPHFWIAYQLIKKPFRDLMNRAMNAGIKKAWSK